MLQCALLQSAADGAFTRPASPTSRESTNSPAPLRHVRSVGRMRSMRTPVMEKVGSSSSLNLARNIGRLSFLRDGDNAPRRTSSAYGANHLTQKPLLHRSENENSFRSLPQNVYTKEDPSLVGVLKSDILSVRGKIDDIRGKPDSEASDLIRTIAKYTACDDMQVEMKSRLFLMEIRDNQMFQLEMLLHDRLSPLCHDTTRSTRQNSFYSLRSTGSRMASYMAMVDLLLAFAVQSQELRQLARERDACIQSMDSQLRSLLGALETQNEQLQEFQKTAQAERDRLEAAQWAICLERDAAQASAQQLRQTVAALEETSAEMQQELAYLRSAHDSLRRECSSLGGELAEMSQLDETPQRYMSTKLEFCDQCPTLNALCNALKQEKEELNYIIQKLKQDRDKLFLETKEAKKNLENERERRQDLLKDFGSLTSQHRNATATIDRQENVLLSVQQQMMDLMRGHVLQAEAGERLALVAQQEADMHHMLRELWHCRSWSVETDLWQEASQGGEEGRRDLNARTTHESEVRQLRLEVQTAAVRAAQLKTTLQLCAESSNGSTDYVAIASALQAQLSAALQKFDSLPRVLTPREELPARH